MDKWEELRQLMVDRGVKLDEGVNANGSQCHWLVDCREVLLVPRGAELITKLLYEKFKTFKSKTVGGLTLAANPIVSYLLLRGIEKKRPVSGFIIRKKPKYNGLQKLIEGDFTPGESVVVVDDLINSGGTIFRAIEIVEEHGCTVEGVLTIVNFSNKGLRRLKETGYRTEYLFTLEDLFVRNKKEDISVPKISWQMEGINNWPESVPRSTPVMHKGKLLFGTNEGSFMSVDSKDGKKVWSLDLDVENPKGILSSPCLVGDRVYFGAYDGYIYCLDANDGKVIWKKKRGDWVGSSPVICGDELAIGIEYGKRGGVFLGCSAEDGMLRWHHETNHYIHSSPACAEGFSVVGCNDNHVYAVKEGKLVWKKDMGREIKAGFVIEEGKVYFGCFDGYCYCLDISDGSEIWKRRLGRIIYSTPEIVEGSVVVSTVSKRIFSLDKSTGSINWYYNTEGRCFSYTSTVDGKVYCGCCAGYLYVIELDSGQLLKKWNVGLEVLTKPLVKDGKVYVGGKGGFICIEI